MHNNPVTRGQVAEPGEWAWSSYRHYATGDRCIVEIESEWTAAKRDRAATESHISEARCRAPSLEEVRQDVGHPPPWIDLILIKVLILNEVSEVCL